MSSGLFGADTILFVSSCLFGAGRATILIVSSCLFGAGRATILITPSFPADASWGTVLIVTFCLVGCSQPDRKSRSIEYPNSHQQERKI